MRFRPHPLGTLGVVLALPILIGLSTWQAGRHTEQVQRLAQVESKLYGDPVTNETLNGTAEDLTWRKAVLTGQFVADAPNFLITGRFEFGQPGLDVVAPFQVEGGPVLLVNRGWIPSDGWQSALQQIANPGPQTLEGLLQELDGSATASPLDATDTLPERYPRDMGSGTGCIPGVMGPPYQTFAAQVSGDVADVVLVAGQALQRKQSKNRSDLPVDGYVPVPKQIGHFEYAVQWALIALTLLAVWAYGSVLRGREEEAQAQKPDAQA